MADQSNKADGETYHLIAILNSKMYTLVKPTLYYYY